MKVYCKDCRWYKELARWEFRINGKFIFPDCKPPCFVREGGKACYHPVCFKKKRVESIEDGVMFIPERIQGQAQLNRNFDCKYFEPTFWFRIKQFFGGKK